MANRRAPDDISGLPTAPGATDAAATPAELPVVPSEHYQLLKEHARGGMGRVLVGFDLRLGRSVAVKELLSQRPDAAVRFVREALVTARLQHPSIVPVHEAGRWPTGEPFYVMKLVQGRPLHLIIREERALERRLALLPVVIAVAEAMAYAHSRGVIHRDLKPANVVVGEFGETVVIDWGLAKDLAAKESEPAGPTTSDVAVGATLEGAIVGTPGYMAPEQAMGEPADARSDVYSLGAILYTTLAGAPPYPGLTPDAVLYQTQKGDPQPLVERQPGVPEDLLAVVAKAMARDPAARYESARELAADLKRFQTGQLVGAQRYSTAALVRRWLKRHRLEVGVAALALMVVAAMGALSVARVIRERDRADGERAVAERERAKAETARARESDRVDELVLAQARAALDRDPTASLAWLKRLNPSSPNWRAAHAVAANAAAHGVAERMLVGHDGAVNAVAFSPDSAWLATVGRDHTARLWPAAGGAPILLGSAAGELRAVAFSPDGKWLAAGGADARVRLWSTATRALRFLDGHHDAVESLAFSPDSALLASGSRDATLRLWEPSTGRARSTLSVRGPARQVAFAPDGSLVAARDAEGVRQFDAAGAPRPLADDSLPGTGGLAYSADGRWLAAGGTGETRLWDRRGGVRHIAALSPVNRVAFTPDGARLASVREDGSVVLTETADGVTRELAHHGEPSRDLAFSPDGKRLFAIRGPYARMWEMSSLAVHKLRAWHELDLSALGVSPDGTRVALAGLDGAVQLWRPATFAVERVPVPLLRALPPNAVTALSVGVRRFAAAAADYAIALWQPSGERRLAGHTGPVLRLAFSDDGALLASGGVDQTVRL